MGQADRAVREGKFNEAVAAYLKVLNYAKDREKQIVWDDLGYAYLKKGETALAQRYLERSQDAFPFDYDVKLYMALASDRLGDPASALRFLQVIEKDLFFDDRWFDMARPLKIKNDLGDRVPVEALERMRKIKGVFLLRKGEDEGVLIVDVFNEKNLGLYRYFKGLLLRDLGVPDDAALEFREAGQAGFEIPAGRNPRDEILSRLRHRYKLHPGDLAWFAHEKFLKILEQGNIKEAIRSLEEGLDSDCRSFWMNHNLALLLYDTDDLERSEMHCALALWFRDHDSPSHELMGNIYFRQGLYPQALYEFDRAVTLDGKNASAAYDLGSVHYKLNDVAQAESFWKKAIFLEGGKAGSGGTEEGPEDTPRKQLEYSVRVRKQPVSYLAYRSLGRSLAERGLSVEAANHLENAIRLKPQEPECYLDLAKVLIHLGRVEEAEKSLEKYLYLGGKEKEEARALLDKLK